MKILPVVIETKSITRVGASGVYFDYSAADINIYKIPFSNNGKLYYLPAIPATSFKGLLRSTYERHLRRGSGCDETKLDTMKKSIIETLENYKKEQKEQYNNIIKRLEDKIDKELDMFKAAGLIRDADIPRDLVEKLVLYFQITGCEPSRACYVTSDLDQCTNLEMMTGEEKKVKEIWLKITGRRGICEVCNILGTTGVRGYVKFTDLVAVDPFPVYIERFTHVAINRILGVAERGKLFNEEVIPSGVKFLGFLAVLEDSKLETVLNMLRVLKEKADKNEVWIGGRGTAGYGSFTLYLPGEVVDFSENSLIRMGGLNLKAVLSISEPEKIVSVSGLLSKLFPPYLFSALQEIREGPPVFEILDESGNILASANSSEELYRIISSDPRLKGMKYRIRSKGVYTA